MGDREKFWRFLQRNKRIILSVSLISILNFLAVGLWHSYLSEQILVFWGKSQIGMLSDLLFLEGAIIFAISVFIVSVKPWVSRASRHSSNKSHTGEELVTDVKKPPKIQIDFWILMTIVGAALIGSSIAIGLLLL